MRQLSSSLSPRSKWGALITIAGGLLFVAVRAMEEGLSLRLFLETCGAVAFIWVLNLTFSTDLADEVHDMGDHLVIKDLSVNNVNG